MKNIGWSFGMQSRAASRIGANPDIEGLANAAHEAGIRETIVFGKDHTGFCFYPTRIGVPHPQLKIDLTGAMTQALHERGIRVFAYLNFGMDGETGRSHAAWLQQMKPGETLLTEDHLANICVFSPYTERLILPLLREMLERYDVDGFFLDTMNAFNVCYCESCRAAFRQECRQEMPVDMADPGWSIHGPYQSRRTERLMARIRNYVKALNQDGIVIFNHLGGPVWPLKTPGIISCDPVARHPWISLFANYLSSGPQTGDVFIERFYCGWGDRNGVTDLTLEHKAASIFAHNQRFFVGDRLHPEARFAPGSRRAMRQLTALWQKMNNLMPPMDAPRSPDVLILYSENNVFGVNRKFFGENRGRALLPIVGAQQLLTDAGCNFLQTPELHLERWLKSDRLLILPELEVLNSGTELLIREFIMAGGRVLAIGTPPRLENGSLPDWLGLDAVEDAVYQNCVYLPRWKQTDDADEELVLAHGDIHRVFPGSAEPRLYGFSQYDLSYMGSGPNSASSEPDRHPLLTVNAFGRGQVFYLNAPIFTDYSRELDGLRIWTGRLLREIAPEMAYSLDSPFGQVELVSYEAGQASWHVLLNHGGLRDAAVSERHQKVAAPQPVLPITLKIRSEQPLPTVKINGEDIKPQRRGNVYLVPVIMDAVWKIIKI